MILVVEGISVSGKTTWCWKHAGGRVVPENGLLHGAPDRARDPLGAAALWVARNVDRWQAALAIERDGGWAVCDTDPLKLHYIWCLWQIGETDERHWLLELAATRQAIHEGMIGFADCYIVGQIEPEFARERAQADPTRRRRHFHLHVRLQTGLMQWYSALDRATPGRVRFGFPSEMPVLRNQGKRYDLVAFDQMIAALPKTPCQPPSA